jgi:ribosomal protein S18 acetylase RimI-like enzyme
MEDLEEINKILEIWNHYYVYDPTSRFQLERKFFKNKFLEPIGPLVYGDAYSLMCKKSNLENVHQNRNAWIMSMAYTQKKDLSDLLESQIRNAKAAGITKLSYSNFIPGYFFPGIDDEKYPEIKNILVDKGFNVESEALAMEAKIGEIKYEETKNNKVNINNLQIEDIKEFLNFVKQNFPYDCYLRVSGVVEKGDIEQISVAKVQNNIVGYSMYASGEGKFEFAPGERFGCFEVLEGYRSLGIGSGLLVKTLINMKGNGIRHAYFLWTSERAAHLYQKYGFKVTRKFKIMSMEI